MTLLHIVMGNKDIDVLSISEICDLCKFLITHIITYFKEVLVTRSPPERICLSKHQQYLLSCIDVMGNVGSEEYKQLNKNSILHFHNFMYEAINCRKRSNAFKVSLDLPGFQPAGPVALVKLMNSLINSAIHSLNRKAPSHISHEIYEKSLKGVTRTINSILNILSPVSQRCEYTVEENTHLCAIIMVIDREEVVT